jgi:hypothetical protein
MSAREQLLDQDKQKGYVCNIGDYCSPQMRTPTVPGSGGGIFHRTTTKIVEGKATTDVFIISDNNQWVKAATTTDGGKTYSFNESTRPNGSKIVGQGVRQSLAPNGDMNKNVKAQVTSTLKSGGAQPTASTPNLTNEQIKQTNAVSSNNATTTIDSDLLSSSIGDGREGTRNEFQGAAGTDPLKYPLNLKSEHQDVIKFQMLKYEPKKFDQQKFGFSERSRTIQSTIGTVVLPIPAGISDQNAVTWSDGTMNAAEAALANLALSGIEKGGEGLTSTATDIANTIVGASDDVKKAIAASFAGQATGVAGILARTTGAIINPNLELLFNAPTLRPFNFTFKLSARSKREAEAIRSIIRFFKQGMSPIRTESNLFLKAPHTFQLQYLHRGKQHNYLNRFKECALQSFSVDYTPEGQYATFTDGAMVSYQITMQFSELEPVFNDDYGALDNNADTQIGY